MNILAIDTCFTACSVAVGVGIDGDCEPVAGQVQSIFQPMQRGHAEALVAMISQVMSLAAIGFDDLDRIAVTTGPGSFTGTRIGIATARALALAANKPLVGGSSLAVMASSSRIDCEITPEGEATTAAGICELAILVDARRDQVYGQLFDLETREAKTEPMLLDLDDAAQIGSGGPILFAGSAGDFIADLSKAAGRKITVQCTDLLPDIADYVTRAAAIPLPANGANAVKPLYMRQADAKPQTGKSIARAQ